MIDVTLTLKIEVPELTAAILRLADAMAPVKTKVAVAAPVTTPAATAAPVAAPAAPVTAPPVAPTSPGPGYTLEQLSRAGAELVSADPGKMPQLTGLLQQFDVQAITMLPPEQYGAFATALRGLGAKL